MKLLPRLTKRVRKAFTRRADEGFYPQVPDCQIRNLSFLYELVFGRLSSGVFVEIGAHDGVFVSNSFGLAKRGWTGWLVEPHPDFADQCRRNLRQFPRCTVVETAVASPGVSSVELHIAGPLTTANLELLTEYRSTTWAADEVSNAVLMVPSETLDALLSRLALDQGFEVLIVDVEGFESQVFSGFDLQTWRPKMLIVELADTHPDLASTAKSDAELSRAIQETGYQVVYKDAVNTVFVANDVWWKAQVRRSTHS